MGKEISRIRLNRLYSESNIFEERPVGAIN